MKVLFIFIQITFSICLKIDYTHKITHEYGLILPNQSAIVANISINNNYSNIYLVNYKNNFEIIQNSANNYLVKLINDTGLTNKSIILLFNIDNTLNNLKFRKINNLQDLNIYYPSDTLNLSIEEITDSIRYGQSLKFKITGLISSNVLFDSNNYELKYVEDSLNILRYKLTNDIFNIDLNNGHLYVLPNKIITKETLKSDTITLNVTIFTENILIKPYYLKVNIKINRNTNNKTHFDIAYDGSNDKFLLMSLSKQPMINYSLANITSYSGDLTKENFLIDSGNIHLVLSTFKTNASYLRNTVQIIIKASNLSYFNLLTYNFSINIYFIENYVNIESNNHLILVNNNTELSLPNINVNNFKLDQCLVNNLLANYDNNSNYDFIIDFNDTSLVVIPINNSYYNSTRDYELKCKFIHPKLNLVKNVNLKLISNDMETLLEKVKIYNVNIKISDLLSKPNYIDQIRQTLETHIYVLTESNSYFVKNFFEIDSLTGILSLNSINLNFLSFAFKSKVISIFIEAYKPLFNTRLEKFVKDFDITFNINIINDLNINYKCLELDFIESIVHINSQNNVYFVYDFNCSNQSVITIKKFNKSSSEYINKLSFSIKNETKLVAKIEKNFNKVEDIINLYNFDLNLCFTNKLCYDLNLVLLLKFKIGLELAGKTIKITKNINDVKKSSKIFELNRELLKISSIIDKSVIPKMIEYELLSDHNDFNIDSVGSIYAKNDLTDKPYEISIQIWDYDKFNIKRIMLQLDVTRFEDNNETKFFEINYLLETQKTSIEFQDTIELFSCINIEYYECYNIFSFYQNTLELALIRLVPYKNQVLVVNQMGNKLLISVAKSSSFNDHSSTSIRSSIGYINQFPNFVLFDLELNLNTGLRILSIKNLLRNSDVIGIDYSLTKSFTNFTYSLVLGDHYQLEDNEIYSFNLDNNQSFYVIKIVKSNIITKNADIFLSYSESDINAGDVLIDVSERNGYDGVYLIESILNENGIDFKTDFKFESNKIILLTKSNLDREYFGYLLTFNIIKVIVDSTSLKVTKIYQFNINVEIVDTNDNKPKMNQYYFNLEFQKSALIIDSLPFRSKVPIIKLNGTDDDLNGDLVYSIAYTDNQKFFDIDQAGQLFLILNNDRIFFNETFEIIVNVDDGLNNIGVMVVINLINDDFNTDINLSEALSSKSHLDTLKEYIKIDNVSPKEIFKFSFNLTGEESKFLRFRLPVSPLSCSINEINGNLTCTTPQSNQLIRIPAFDMRNLLRIKIITIELMVAPIENTINNSSLTFNVTFWERNLNINLERNISVGMVILDLKSKLGIEGLIQSHFDKNNQIDESFFNLNSNTGQIILKRDINENYKNYFNLSINILLFNESLQVSQNIRVKLNIVSNRTPSNKLIFPFNSYLFTINMSNFTTIDENLVQIGLVKAYTRSSKVTYYLQSADEGSDESYFIIDPFNGILSFDTNSPIRTKYSFYVVAQDLSDFYQSASVLVRVHRLDVQTNSQVTTLSQKFQFKKLYSARVYENCNIRTFVLKIELKNEVTGVKFYFTDNSGKFKSTSDSGYFLIDNSTGEIITNRFIDRESLNTSSFLLNVVAIKGSLYVQTTIEIIIDDINDNYPEFIDKYQNLKLEMPITMAPVKLFKLKALDRDVGLNSDVIYLLNSNEYFELGLTDGQLAIRKLPNELGYSQKLTIIAQDNGLPSLKSQPINLDITFINRSTDFQINIPYNFALNDTVFNIKDIYPNTYQYIQIANQNITLFSYDRETGDLKTKEWFKYYQIDKEFNISFQLNQNFESEIALLKLKIVITDINEFSPTIDATNTTLYVSSLTSNQFIYQFQAHDDDYGQNGEIRFFLSNPSNYLYLNEKSGELTLRKNNLTPSLLRVFVYAKDMGFYPRKSEMIELNIIITDNLLSEISFSQNTYQFVLETNQTRIGEMELRTRYHYDNDLSSEWSIESYSFDNLTCGSKEDYFIYLNSSKIISLMSKSKCLVENLTINLNLRSTFNNSLQKSIQTMVNFKRVNTIENLFKRKTLDLTLNLSEMNSFAFDLTEFVNPAYLGSIFLLQNENELLLITLNELNLSIKFYTNYTIPVKNVISFQITAFTEDFKLEHKDKLKINLVLINAATSLKEIFVSKVNGVFKTLNITEEENYDDFAIQTNYHIVNIEELVNLPFCNNSLFRNCLIQNFKLSLIDDRNLYKIDWNKMKIRLIKGNILNYINTTMRFQIEICGRYCEKINVILAINYLFDKTKTLLSYLASDTVRPVTIRDGNSPIVVYKLRKFYSIDYSNYILVNSSKFSIEYETGYVYLNEKTIENLNMTLKVIDLDENFNILVKVNLSNRDISIFPKNITVEYFTNKYGILNQDYFLTDLTKLWKISSLTCNLIDKTQDIIVKKDCMILMNKSIKSENTGITIRVSNRGFSKSVLIWVSLKLRPISYESDGKFYVIKYKAKNYQALVKFIDYLVNYLKLVIYHNEDDTLIVKTNKLTIQYYMGVRILNIFETKSLFNLTSTTQCFYSVDEIDSQYDNVFNNGNIYIMVAPKVQLRKICNTFDSDNLFFNNQIEFKKLSYLIYDDLKLNGYLRIAFSFKTSDSSESQFMFNTHFKDIISKYSFINCEIIQSQFNIRFSLNTFDHQTIRLDKIIHNNIWYQFELLLTSDSIMVQINQWNQNYELTSCLSNDCKSKFEIVNMIDLDRAAIQLNIGGYHNKIDYHFGSLFLDKTILAEFRFNYLDLFKSRVLDSYHPKMLMRENQNLHKCNNEIESENCSLALGSIILNTNRVEKIILIKPSENLIKYEELRKQIGLNSQSNSLTLTLQAFNDINSSEFAILGTRNTLLKVFIDYCINNFFKLIISLFKRLILYQIN